ncbi:hypothetical protein HDU78_009070, partial [Chytriomyces hyalinus]
MNSLCLALLTLVSLMVQVSATATYAPSKTSIENQPCQTFGAYRCDGTSLFQCGYTTGNKLVWRLLWDCGSDLTCTVVPGGFVGCTAPAYEKLGKEKEEYYEEEYDECSADYKYEDKHCQYGDCAAKYSRSVCKFGAWRCKGNAVQQCGYVAGNVLQWRWVALAESLQGVDALVSVVGGPGIGSQEHLIHASIQAGVKRFTPSEYGIDLDWHTPSIAFVGAK